MDVIALVGTREFGRADIPVPEPGPGDVLVRVGAIAICGSDLTAYLGGHTRISLPSVLGHEFAGEVAAIGPGVDRVRPGQRVAGDPTIGCGSCGLCLAGRSNICPDYSVMGIRLSHPGAMAGLVSLPQDRVHLLPDEIPLEVGALVQPLSVSYHAAVHRGGIAEGELALVMGAGAIGLGVIMAAKLAGATVIAADPIPYRRDLAAALGADIVVDPVATDVGEIVSRSGDGLGADLAFEAVGGRSDDILLQAVRATRPGGRTIVIGLKMPEARFPAHELKSSEKTILGSQAHPDTFPSVIAEVARGTLPAARLISHRLPVSEAPRAFELLESRAGQVMKVVLRPDPA